MDPHHSPGVDVSRFGRSKHLGLIAGVSSLFPISISAAPAPLGAPAIVVDGPFRIRVLTKPKAKLERLVAILGWRIEARMDIQPDHPLPAFIHSLAAESAAPMSPAKNISKTLSDIDAIIHRQRIRIVHFDRYQ